MGEGDEQVEEARETEEVIRELECLKARKATEREYLRDLPGTITFREFLALELASTWREVVPWEPIYGEDPPNE